MTFGEGAEVRLARDLPGLRAGDSGVVRGRTASAAGVSYAVRFERLMRVVAELDLLPSVGGCSLTAVEKNTA